MEYEIYTMSYNLGILPLQESVVSTSSPERAKSLLEDHLNGFLRGYKWVKEIGFDVISVKNTKIKTSQEAVVSPTHLDYDTIQLITTGRN